ncbi:hypothetical protein AMAG_07036 [Allomyces macrogynus ATCC 38327]|uniref:Uncharacterized protein n=1 Tax=Allomyces macrogynus (strain ATCC 38327) TaxID=578462 RepID=A0A0L0SFZ6_ALLM3|nr:hypothetical protein AMAG_07036 [Allomyces macrogynus ATCC 38327]|eukprot:KNE61295.1 hypothetical protein AMAG_07036 [Allomyces macrogynus ATCC 38327]
MALLRLSNHGTHAIADKYGLANDTNLLPSPERPLRDGASSPRRFTRSAAAFLGVGVSDTSTRTNSRDGSSPWIAARTRGKGRVPGPVDFMKLATSWDRGSKSVRERILSDFIHSCRLKTGPQLEQELGLGASLFLTRISAWLRLTYLLNYNLAMQMEAISIFLSAAGGSRFLNEFLEIGGVLTLLEMISLPQVKERDKAMALKLLIHIASAGRKHKEFICECQGVRAISECLARSRFDLTQDHARHLLQELGSGNPKYLMQVYKTLLALLTSPSSLVAQQMAGQALRALLPSIPTIHVSIVEATLALLKSPQLPLQHEGFEVLRQLLPRTNLQDAILAALIEILQMPVDDGEDDNGQPSVRGKRGGRLKTTLEKASPTPGDPMFPKGDAVAHLYMQQSYAARLLGMMAASSAALAERMVHGGVLMGLVMTTANVKHPDSQKSAASLLQYLAQTVPTVRDLIRDQLGSTFYEFSVAKPDTYFRELNRDQVRYLRRNAVRLRARTIRSPVAAAAMGRGRDEEMPLTPEQQREQLMRSRDVDLAGTPEEGGTGGAGTVVSRDGPGRLETMDEGQEPGASERRDAEFAKSTARDKSDSTTSTSTTSDPTPGKLVPKRRLAASNSHITKPPGTAPGTAAAPLPAIKPGATADDVYRPYEPVVVAGSLSGSRFSATTSTDPPTDAPVTAAAAAAAVSSAATAAGRIEAAMPVDDAVRAVRARQWDAELRRRFPGAGADGGGGADDVGARRASVVSANAVVAHEADVLAHSFSAAAALRALSEAADEDDEEEDGARADDDAPVGDTGAAAETPMVTITGAVGAATAVGPAQGMPRTPVIMEAVEEEEEISGGATPAAAGVSLPAPSSAMGSRRRVVVSPPRDG